MKFLFTDHINGQKSLTITGLILTFTFALCSGILLLQKAVTKNLSSEDIAFGLYSLSFLAIFVSLYWNKRVRMSEKGIEISDNLGKNDNNFTNN